MLDYININDVLATNGTIAGERYRQVDIDAISSKTTRQYITRGTDENTGLPVEFISAPSGNLFVELHVYDIMGNRLLSDYNVEWQSSLNTSISIDSFPSLILNTRSHLNSFGISRGRYRIVYNFFVRELGTTDNPLFIKSISPSRTEIRVLSVDNTLDYATARDSFLNKDSEISEFERPSVEDIFRGRYLKTVGYATYFRKNLVLNLGNNVIIPIVNWAKDIQTDPEEPSIVLKLYAPLPPDIIEKNRCWIVNEYMPPAISTVLLSVIEKADIGRVLRGPNFEAYSDFSTKTQTEFECWDDILSTDSDTSQQLIDYHLSGSFETTDLKIDYRNFENFIHFSSAVERLANFKYKLTLIERYKEQAATLDALGASSASAVVVSDIALANRKANNVISGFDNFEKYLYFESGSAVSSSEGYFPNATWPKYTGNRTYSLYSVSSSQVTEWYNQRIATASLYDTTNDCALVKSVPLHIINDSLNDSYVLFVNMIAQHFDILWTYINELTKINVKEHREIDSMPESLIYDTIKSMGWNVYEGLDNVDLWEYTLGTDITGSYMQSGSVSPSIPRKNMTKEIWRRILNNLPYILKTKGTARSIKALITCYGIPSSILEVREYGGPEIEDTGISKYIKETFTYALDFSGGQFVSSSWTDVSGISRKPDSVETRLKTVLGNKISIAYTASVLFEGMNEWAVTLEQSSSNSQFGFVKFYLSGSDGYKNCSTTKARFFDGDWWSVLLRRNVPTGSSDINQTYEILAGQYAFNKVFNLVSGSMSVPGADNVASQSYNTAFETDASLLIGGVTSSVFGTNFTGSMQEFRLWRNPLQTGVFRGHITAPFSYDGNTPTSSFYDLIVRYRFNENVNHSTTSTITDHTPDQTDVINGIAKEFADEINYSVVEQQQELFTPSIGPTRFTDNKIRVVSSSLLAPLSPLHRAETNAYTLAPLDSPKVGIYLSPTNVVNDDIISQIGNARLDDYIGDPRDLYKENYPDLMDLNRYYWKKYAGAGNNIWDYMRLLSYFDASLFQQIRQLLPARVKSSLGFMIEPHILERYKSQFIQPLSASRLDYSASLDVYNDVIVMSMSAAESFPNYTASLAHAAFYEPAVYSYDMVLFPAGMAVTCSTPYWEDEAIMPYISGSRKSTYIYEYNYFYSSSLSASRNDYYSSSLSLAEVQEYEPAYIRLLFYEGCTQTKYTTPDGKDPVEVTITNPNKLVTQEPTAKGRIKMTGGLPTAKKTSLFGGIFRK